MSRPKTHINHQGGSRFPALNKEAQFLLHWAERHLRSLSAEHIKGINNVEEDWLSTISDEAFSEVMVRFGDPVVDLFATAGNSKGKSFMSRFFHPEAVATDARTSPWPPGLLYVFPPFTLIPAVIRRGKRCSHPAVLAPRWMRRH